MAWAAHMGLASPRTLPASHRLFQVVADHAAGPVDAGGGADHAQDHGGGEAEPVAEPPADRATDRRPDEHQESGHRVRSSRQEDARADGPAGLEIAVRPGGLFERVTLPDFDRHLSRESRE